MAKAVKSASVSSSAVSTEKVDIYDQITNKILAQLEQGNLPWQMPWKTRKAGDISRPLRSCGTPYSGINVLQLWLTAMENQFTSQFWFTFNQVKELGGSVKKGSKGTRVVYASTYTKKDQDEAGNEVEQNIPFLKTYVVFNADQCEGLAEKYYAKQDENLDVNAEERREEVDAFFAKTLSTIVHGCEHACYKPSVDVVEMPNFERFLGSVEYYSTLAHEHIHWTKHKSRLDRSFNQKRFGDAGYALEELVAELGSAFLCADLGIESMAKAGHAAYIASWITVLKNDKRAIFTAASMASRAVEYLHSLQSK